MTLQQLCDDLLPSFPPSVQKDIRTAVRVLAKALQYTDPAQCALEDCNRPLPTLYRLVETSLIDQGKGPHTIRNTKNNLSRLFRLAAQHHRFALVPVPLTPRHASSQKPPRPGVSFKQQHATYLTYAQWPTGLQEAFTTFATWATAPLVPGRPVHLRKRLTTLEVYQRGFESYFGYLHHIEHLSPTFDHLFDIGLLTTYVHWHVNECHKKPTRTLRNFLMNLLALTRQYRPLPELRLQLTALLKTVPMPPPTYNKADAWVSLATLEEIAHALWPRKRPADFLRQDQAVPGSKAAAHAALSLMFRLWTYRPYRQRNMREMRLGDNLHKDAQGHWRITFRGEQLKIATKRGRTNVFDLPFPEKLVPLLEDYLATWRPLLLAKASHPHPYVFLTWCGTPYKQANLTKTTQENVYRFTGKHWHPHIVRSVWATEWIRKTGDL
jgi:hypothetical protein